MKTKAKNIITVLLSAVMIISALSAVGILASADEIDGIFDNAPVYTMGTQVKGTATEPNYYQFTLDESGRVTVDFTVNNGTSYYIYDSNGNTVCDHHVTVYDAGTLTDTFFFDLTSGKYCLSIQGSTYAMTMKFTSANESFRETLGGSNNTIQKASLIDLNKLYKGQLASNDYYDFYKFTVTQNSNTNIYIEAYMGSLTYRIYDATAKELYKDQEYKDEFNEKIELTKTYSLAPGTYYLSIDSESWNGYVNYSSGNYSFSVSDGNGTVAEPTTAPATKAPTPITTAPVTKAPVITTVPTTAAPVITTVPTTAAPVITTTPTTTAPIIAPTTRVTAINTSSNPKTGVAAVPVTLTLISGAGVLMLMMKKRK